MKKIIAIICTAFVLVTFGGTAFSQETDIGSIEQHLQNARQMPAEEILNRYPDEKGMTRRSSANFSKNPADLSILAGTTWEFTYTVQETYTDTVTFVPYIEYEDDGEIHLVCVDDMLFSGLTVFKPSTGKFMTLLMSGDMSRVFQFKVSGDSAEGVVGFSFDDGETWTEFPMTGKRTAAAAGVSSSCIPVGNDLKMPVCVEYAGTNYGFDLDFSPNPADPFGLYWKMDMSTLTVE
jgi:hypothetical protein